VPLTLDDVLRRSVAAEPTFPEAGASQAAVLDGGALPGGYHHLRYRRRVGRGSAAFAAAGVAVMTWQMHRGAGIRVAAADPVAVVGSTMVSALGIGPLHLSAPCRIVWTVDEPTRRGFGYATLPGHPEQGEEAFLVELGTGREGAGREGADDEVWLTVLAFSRPGLWYTRLASPVVVALQRVAASAYGWSVARAVRRGALG
jgi:uncharacterized protein (UPF0548 family)